MNAFIDFKYQDKNLAIQKYNSNILSILIIQDGFVFYIYDKKELNLLHFEKRTNPKSGYFKQVIDTQIALIKEFSKFNLMEVRFLIPSNKVTIVPTAIFDESRTTELYQLNFEASDHFLIHSHRNQNYNSVLLYPVPEGFKLLNEEFNGMIKFYNQLIPFMDFVSMQPSEKGFEMFINIMSDNFDIMVVKDHQLKFLNSFHYQSNNDFLYFILNVLKQLDINRSDVAINLIGVKSKNDEKLKSLPHFIDKVFFYKELKLRYNFAVKQEDILEHLNFLNLHLCAL